jgi:Mg2+ and Co2+ transporter CorA
VLEVMLAILLPLVIVFGLYGMYVTFFGSVTKESTGIYLSLIAIFVVFSGGVIAFLRRKHLI